MGKKDTVNLKARTRKLHLTVWPSHTNTHSYHAHTSLNTHTNTYSYHAHTSLNTHITTHSSLRVCLHHRTLTRTSTNSNTRPLWHHTVHIQYIRAHITTCTVYSVSPYPNTCPTLNITAHRNAHTHQQHTDSHHNTLRHSMVSTDALQDTNNTSTSY